MPDGNILPFPARPLRVVKQSPAGRYDFRRPSFRPADPGSVMWGNVRLGPQSVAQLKAIFSKEEAWELHDDLLSARDGIFEPPMGEPAP